jgi:hypothetical protein
MQQLLAQAQQMQQQLMQTQEELAASEVSGQAGNGLVRATLDGTGELTGITIDPKVVDPDDIDTLQDLVLGAVSDAHDKLRALAEEKMGPLAGGLGSFGLPGM